LTQRECCIGDGSYVKPIIVAVNVFCLGGIMDWVCDCWSLVSRWTSTYYVNSNYWGV